MRTVGSQTVAACLGLAFALAGGAPAAWSEEGSAAIIQWVHSYEAVFDAKDLARLATFYHPEVTIYEGGGVNRGWADYRDHHIGPELEEMQDPRLSHTNIDVQFLDKDHRAAYVTSEYRLQTRVKDRDVDAGGLETLILVQGGDGRWVIRHSHTSSRRRSPSAPAPSATPPAP